MREFASLKVAIAGLLAMLSVSSGLRAAGRVERTAAALDALAAACRRLEEGGRPALPYRIPLIVGRQALAQAPKGEEPDPMVLDQVYLDALKARVALLEAAEKGLWPRIPPAADLGKVSFEGGRCAAEGRVVFPTACEEKRGEVGPFFASGAFRQFLPALAGVVPGAEAKSEVFRLFRSDPTARRVGWDGPAGGFVREGEGPKPPILICIGHPGIREAIARATAQALYAVRPQRRPLYASLGDECFYVDYSQFSARAFIEWVKRRYGSLRTVNAAWGTQFREFSAEMMPRPEEAGLSSARWFDWVDFNRARLSDHVAWACGNIRKVVPQLPLGLGFFSYALAGSRGLSGVDPTALAATLDVLEANDSDAMTLDLAVGVAEGRKPVVDAAVGPGAFGLLAHFLHGCAAVRLRRWPPAPLTSPGAVREAERVLREALAARRFAREIGLLTAVKRPVALLYSDASMLQVPPSAVRCGQTPYTGVLRRLYEAARFLGVGCRFITSQAVARRRWEGVKVIVVAGSPAEEDEVVRGLLEFVELGGELVVVAESLVMDTRGREADHLARLGIEPLETQRPRLRARPRPERGGALDELAVEGVPGCRLAVVRDGLLGARGGAMKARGTRQRIRVNVAHETLAVFPDGSPAVVRFRRGKGWVTYFAMCPEARAVGSALGRILESAGAAPATRLVGQGFDTWGVEWASARDGQRTLVWLWNTTEGPKRLSVGLAGHVAKAVNVVEDEALAITRAGQGSLVGPVHLAPGATAILRVESGSEE